MNELLNIYGKEITITLKEITDIIEVRHDKAKQKIEELSQEESFGTMAEIDIVYNDQGQTTKTYILSKKQAIAVGAKLNNGLLMKLIDKIEELENSKRKPMTFEEVMKNALMLADQKVQELENKIEDDKPRVEFANTVADSSDVILVREYVKLIYNEEGINIGQNKLYKWFRDNGYLNKKNEPFQNYLRYFKVVETTQSSIFGTKINKTTKITGQGQLYFLPKIRKDYE